LEVFGVFEGGGAKGLAHVAAFAAAQRQGIRFLGVAGSSAGAIVAALIAAGHTPKALYDPDTGAGFLSGDLTELLGGHQWRTWAAMNVDAEYKFKRASLIRIWGMMPFYWWTWRKVLRDAVRRRGLFDTQAFETQFERWLQAAKAPPAGENRLRFRDLDQVPLKDHRERYRESGTDRL
jgi:NTE family protein